MRFCKELFYLSSITLVSCFFDFLQTAPNKVVQGEVVQNNLVSEDGENKYNLVRGVPEYLHSKYTTDQFVCDGVKYNKSIVNDGFCDCLDKTDEPGTNACGSGLFYCINKGYKITSIPSSRVDDQVCDCCDGSDEGVVAICPNVCNQAAERERSMLLKVSADYKAGSNIRKGWIDSVIAEKHQLSSSATPLNMELNNLRLESDVLKSKLTELENQKKSLDEAAAGKRRELIKNFITVDNLSFSEMSHFLSNLLKLLGMKGDKLDKLIKQKQKINNVSVPASAIKEDDNHMVGDNEAYDDGHMNEGYQEEGEEETSFHEEGATILNSDVGDTTEATSSCDMIDITSDFDLLSLCDIIDNVVAAENFLADLLLQQPTASHEIMLLLGYYHMYNTFSNSYDHLSALVTTNPSNREAAAVDSCPAEYSSTPLAQIQCARKAVLTVQLQKLDEQSHVNDVITEIEILQRQLADIDTNMKAVTVKHDAALLAVQELGQYSNQLEYLALKDQCFSVTDGAFEYTVCIMGEITQKETSGGGRSVNLGYFQSIEDVDLAKLPQSQPIKATAVMKHGNGQHCHAFGARTASVQVVCAPSNNLLSAAEPSTCAYELVLQSPAACTSQYAQWMGIA